MLTELRIQDFAIIDHVTLKFSDGFSIITGETGAGKSILIDAVDLALGGKAETSFVRAGTDKAIVEIDFLVPNTLRSEIRSLLESNDIEIKSLERLTLRREVRESGRSSARVNDVVCKLAIYREIGGLLLDIHGQTEHLSLLNPKNHLILLDRFADLEEPREALGEVVRKYHNILRTMDSLQQNERQREQRIEFLKFQVEEIEAARLVEGEEESLRETRNRLANAEKLASFSEESYNILYGEDEFGASVIDALNRAAAAVDRLASIDASMSEQVALAENVVAYAEELGDAMRHYLDKVEVDPAQLEETEERLELISRLKRKYGDSIKAVLESAELAREELDNIERGEERLDELNTEADSLLRSIGDLAKNISDGRRRYGRKLAKKIETELAALRMDGAQFSVSVTQDEDPNGCYVEDERLAFDVTGIDTVEFMLSANPGIPLRPLAQVASGGETARIMLALKTVLTAADHTPTLIFDEIDQGIGGRLGIDVGHKLWGLTGKHQVMVVTHLAQIAGFADIHYRVSKKVEKKLTRTTIKRLSEAERLHEMADMLGGVSASSMQNAQDLFNTAQDIKQQAKTPVTVPDQMNMFNE